MCCMFWVASGRVQLSIKLRLNSTEEDVKWSGPSNTTISDLKAFLQVRPRDARGARTPHAVRIHARAFAVGHSAAFAATRREHSPQCARPLIGGLELPWA
jgi:hypothetical protein